MRNVFDQYDQPENKLTHALVCTLDRDRVLLRPFLRWLGMRDIPPLRQLMMVEQQVPGEAVSGDEDETRGLPDACVFTREGWAVLFEAKVQAGTGVQQLLRHLKTAARHGYPDARLVIITVDAPPAELPRGVIAMEWRHVFRWMAARAPTSLWARWFMEYLEVFEAKMIARNYGIRGTLTMFNGLHFDHDHPYSYREGKRLIRLLGDQLQPRTDLARLGVDPNAERRPGITGSGSDRVWDILPLKRARGAAAFTSHPHLTMDIGARLASVAITVPHGIKGAFQTQLRRAGEAGFRDMLLDVETSLRPVIRSSPGAKPVVYISQRHHPNRRSAAVTDGEMRFDLRAVVPHSRGPVRYQPEWAEALYAVLAHKRSNIQFGMSVQFQYGCKLLGSPKATDLFAASWLAMRPFLDFVLDA
jgi:hypothetical protein